MGVTGAVHEVRRWRRYATEMARGLGVHARRRDEAPASLARRVAEQWRLLLANRITAQDYYLYGLQRRDLSWARKREFVGEMERRSWQERLNPGFYEFFTKDKVVTKRYLAQAGAPVPRLLAVIGPTGRAETGEPLRTPGELGRWLADAKVEQVVLKPVRGARGEGVLVLGERMDGALEWERIPAGRIDLDGILAHLRSYVREPEFLVEDRLRPHPDLAVFSAEVLHTARILTVLEDDAQVVAAALRIGVGSAPVDNFSQGNLAAPIDLATGRLGAAVSRASGLSRHRRHPVTGATIEGRPVPDWDRAVAVLRAAARVVPFNPVQGWDLAFTAMGPVIVEANGRWDPDVTQLAPDRGLLGTPLRGYLERRGLLTLFDLDRAS